MKLARLATASRDDLEAEPGTEAVTPIVPAAVP